MKIQGLLALVLLQTEFGHGQELLSGTQLFQCQSSTDQSGQVFTPNIPDFYFNGSTIRTNGNFTQERTETGFTHIYTIPTDSEGYNCSGTAVAIQYCVAINISNKERTSFNLLILDQDGLQFTVRRRIRVGPPEDIFCSPSRNDNELVCCTREALSSTEQFQISSSLFTLGILPRFSQLLSVPTENGVGKFQAVLSELGKPNTNFTGTMVESSSLLVMRLIIEPEPTPSSPTIAAPVGTEDLNLPSNSTSFGNDSPSIGIFTVGMIIAAVTAGGLLILLTAALIILLVLQVRRRERRRSGTKKMAPENFPPPCPQRHEDMPITRNEAFQEPSVESSANRSRTEDIQNESFQEPSVESSVNRSKTEDIPLTQNEAYRALSVESINRYKTNLTPDITDRTYVIPTMNMHSTLHTQILTDNYDYVIPSMM